MPVKMLPAVEPDTKRLLELSREIDASPVVGWVDFAILRTYHQVYRFTPKPKGWRRLLRATLAIRRKYGC